MKLLRLSVQSEPPHVGCYARFSVSLILTAVLLVFITASHAAELSRTNVLEYRSAEQTLPVISILDWEKRRTAILEAMQKVMGPLPGKEKRVPLDVRKESEVDRGDYIEQFISYQAEPGSRVPAYLLIPKAVKSNVTFPAVLALHQTHPMGQKVVVGLGNSTNDEYGVRLVKRGFVILAPPYPLLADYNPDVKGLGYQSGTMLAIWNNIRALDLLESLPFVRTNHGFGVIGHSLGGHNGIFTAAFDRRIKVIVSSCGFDAFRDYMDGNIKGWTSIRYMPRLLDYTAGTCPFDFDEMIGCLAPRWFYVNAPLHDANFKWHSVDEVCAEARKVYQLYGRSDHLIVRHPDVQHSFPPAQQEEAFALLGRVLGN